MNKTLKSILAGTLAGVITACSVPAIADSIEALMNSVNIKLDGDEIASVNENYVLQNGAKVPYSILYEGTTYLPVRKISELLEVGIDWDNSTRTVIIEKNKNENTGFDSWYGAPNLGDVFEIKEANQITTVNSTTHWYNIEDVNTQVEERFVEHLESAGFKKVTEGGIKSRLKVYAKGNTEVWLDLGMYTEFFYGVTVFDTSRPIVGTEYSYTGAKEDIPDYVSTFRGNASAVDDGYTVQGDWDLWSNIPCYFQLLDSEGFSIATVNKSFFGKTYSFKKNRSSVYLGYTGTKYSNMPVLSIKY